MQVNEQTRKESIELLDIFKGKVLNPFKTDKWQKKLTTEILELLSNFKLRQRADISKQIRNQYVGFIPTPKANFGNRLRFLFLGKLK